MKKQIFFVIACVLFSFVFSSCHKEKFPEENIIEKAVTDVDGNTYTAVKIGDQVWMAENLRTTKYADGTEIPLDTMEGPSRYYPDGTAASVDKYGYFYNWKAVVNADPDSLQGNVQGICPNGWHVPSDAEWQELVDYVWSQMNPNKSGDTPAKALASKEDGTRLLIRVHLVVILQTIMRRAFRHCLLVAVISSLTIIYSPTMTILVPMQTFGLLHIILTITMGRHGVSTVGLRT